MKISRNAKRSVVIGAYIAIFSLVVLFLYNIFKPAPTCFDGKQNQRERGVDCGGPCAICVEEIIADEIQIKETTFVYGGRGKYDLMARIKNPNNQYGSSLFTYKFILEDVDGSILAEKEGEGFILPQETKYIIETNLETQLIPERVRISISNVKWEEFLGYEEPQLSIYSKRFDEAPQGEVYNKAFGLLRNESFFDFDFIKINVVLRDPDGIPIALNTTQMRTVDSKEERDFILIWPFRFSGEVRNVEMEAEADVYDTQNFVRRYLPEEKFQGYQ